MRGSYGRLLVAAEHVADAHEMVTAVVTREGVRGTRRPGQRIRQVTRALDSVGDELFHERQALVAQRHSSFARR
ncbi:hypothetical protein OG739_37050 [Streptomyces longwoodensis]|uniref:hypothetical protein n=1 Tax=Streptomyces longwoodensis TaxID=68231 RepID=UPI00324F0C95